MTQNTRNTGDPELIAGEETPNSGHVLECDLRWKNLFSFNNSLEAEFSLPGAVSHPRGDRPTSAANRGSGRGSNSSKRKGWVVLASYCSAGGGYNVSQLLGHSVLNEKT